jgi:serine phosphatase RsbU (regulator of sigma subunit)
MDRILSYFSPSLDRKGPRSDFDHAMEAERAQWLRRRFLWWTGLGVAFGLFFTLMTGDPSDGGPEVSAAAFYINMLGSTLLTAVAFVWAWRRKPRFAVILRAAVLVYLISALWGLVANRQILGGMQLEFSRGVDKGLNEASTRSAADPTSATQPQQGPTTTAATQKTYNVKVMGKNRVLNQAAVVSNLSFIFLWLGIISTLFTNHLLACLFLPWTLRESIRPAVLVVLSALLLVTIDCFIQQALWVTIPVLLAILILMHVPGSLWCWWRASRFNHNFRLKYASDRFDELQLELTSARQLHEACLPAPRLTGPIRINYAYEPMRQIGGDLLVVQPADPHSTVATTILLDVTGHGISAALAVNRIVGEIERCFAERPDASPEFLLRNLNNYIYLTLARHAVFVTAIAIRIDSSNGRVDFVNAGHPTAFLVRPDGTRETLFSNAMLLGASPAEDFYIEPGTRTMAVGDAILAYTDGASEASDHEGKMLQIAGVEGLVERARSRTPDPLHWPTEILGQVINHRDAPPQDDTLVVAIVRMA